MGTSGKRSARENIADTDDGAYIGRGGVNQKRKLLQAQLFTWWGCPAGRVYAKPLLPVSTFPPGLSSPLVISLPFSSTTLPF